MKINIVSFSLSDIQWLISSHHLYIRTDNVKYLRNIIFRLVILDFFFLNRRNNSSALLDPFNFTPFYYISLLYIFFFVQGCKSACVSYFINKSIKQINFEYVVVVFYASPLHFC